jgi:hypothetical protein
MSVDPKTSNSTIILKVNSSVNQSDVATDTVKCNYHNTVAPTYSIPIIINGQVLTIDKPVPKKEKVRMRLNVRLPTNFEVGGLVKAGALSNTLKNIVRIEVSKFTQKDFIVMWHGSKDVSSNKAASGMKNILQFVINNLHTNIIVVNTGLLARIF